MTPVQLSASPQFDLLVVGCAGGPSEDNLSCYYIKLKDWPWKTGFVSLEGGSGMGALARLLASHPQSFADFDASSPYAILDHCRAYVISHAHFDHIAGLVLSAGACPTTKHIYGLPRTIANLENVFDGGVWPALAGRSPDGCYVYQTLDADASPVQPVPGVTFRALPVSHGISTKGDAYDSSAFFVTAPSGHSFLFFGDVGADSLSLKARNKAVWQEAARLIAAQQLSTIFIECSYTTARKPEQLYGHLSPPYLFEELRVLASLVAQEAASIAGALRGLTFCIMHVKECAESKGVRAAIQRELEELEAVDQLGHSILMLEQGMRLAL